MRGAIADDLARMADEAHAESDESDRDAAAVAEVLAVLNGCDAHMSLDLVLFANVLRTAAERLGEAIGATYSADILDALFSRFCVGK